MLPDPASSDLKALQELELEDVPFTPPATQSSPLQLAASTVTSSVGSPRGGFRSIPPAPPGNGPETAGPSTPTLAQQHSTKASQHPEQFILHRLEDDTALRDRRRSREDGGGIKLREGFERVRSEMESAARERRKEVCDDVVDWAFWGTVVQDYESVARTQAKELSKAIQKGVPAVIRGPIWQLMSASKSPSLEATYQELIRRESSHTKAISKDINRTFPTHSFFQNAVGRDSLYMVLLAFSLYDPEVGYCQGIAFIVAALLLHMPDEEAFCVLVRLMDSYNLRSHFLADMPGLQLRLFQFDRLLEDIQPVMHTHFLRRGIKSSMYASQWFMTLFSYRFPLALVYRVLDIVFAEGIEAIFRFALALLMKEEDKLLKLEFEDLLTYLQGDLFECYREGEGWRDSDMVRDAYDIRITPLMLDAYSNEYHAKCAAEATRAGELDALRNANRNLSGQVKQLEASLASINQEHVELVRKFVECRIEKEETEAELVRYKLMYAEMAHADAVSVRSRLSAQ